MAHLTAGSQQAGCSQHRILDGDIRQLRIGWQLK
jgi:hypothetical protein